jgi:hypothetical protein
MTTITFDTLKYAERLEKAGIPREHAEAEALADVLASNAQDLCIAPAIRDAERHWLHSHVGTWER